jgi:adenylyltransferase/sulfurtransferase
LLRITYYLRFSLLIENARMGQMADSRGNVQEVGFGELGIVDQDVVDYSNLQRQVIYSTDDVGKSKSKMTEKKIRQINPNVNVRVYEERLTSENALQIVNPYDIVIDGTDNFPTRYLINDACVLLGKPNVYGSVFRFEGQASLFIPKTGPCYRCLYPAPPPPGFAPSCAEGGVLGILPGIIGLIQATEALKLILSQGESLINRLVLYDAKMMTFRELQISRDPSCPICGDNPSIKSLINYEEFCGIGRNSDMTERRSEAEISCFELKERMDSDEKTFLLDVREGFEAEISSLPNAKLIPLNELKNRFYELDPSGFITVYCRSGGRSAQAVDILKELGFDRVRTLKGGINAWAMEIDPDMPIY